ncbi:cyclin-dependent kinase 4 inhibitor D-like [Antedon mediterranea]|uniref:cyclin-dependent kinase 4 inhibitor D-like n=1 Tax=Antedon mediterranea TaxID=105859 RepID=UPI003AF50DC0
MIGSTMENPQENPNPLTIAVVSGDLNEVRSLLQAGFPVNSKNKYRHTALQAVSISNFKMVQLLLEHGANPNLREPVTGCIPLHDAARSGATTTLELLLEYGADANKQDEAGRDTPAHIAARKGHLEAFKMLCHRTDMTIRNHNGQTPLSIADQHNELRNWIKENTDLGHVSLKLNKIDLNMT